MAYEYGLHEVVKLRSQLNTAIRERDNLRGLFEQVCLGHWTFGCDIEFADWQEWAEKRRLLVEVPANDEIREEYDSDTMYAWAWSDAARATDAEGDE